MSGVDCYECRAELCVLAHARLALSTVLYFFPKISSLLLPFLPLLYLLKTRFKMQTVCGLIYVYINCKWSSCRIEYSFTRLSLSASWPARNLKVICEPFRI